MAEKPPRRITKQRAQAFIEATDRGIDEQITDLYHDRGVKLLRDGRREFEAGADMSLLTEDEAAELEERIESILRAIDTLAIFRRRYG